VTKTELRGKRRKGDAEIIWSCQYNKSLRT
jgi:hypothetical protein